MDDLGWLRLSVEWGADEALDVAPRDRLTSTAAAAAVSVMAPRVELAVAGGVVAHAQAIAAAAGDLAALEQALAELTLCPLQATAIHLVFAEGEATSGVMVIGDAPGEEEDRSGRPFSGAGGRLLERMLGSIGLARDAVRLAYGIPWRPPGNRKPTESERALCLPFLYRHIALVAPRYLLLLGTPAAITLLGGTSASLRRKRGQWQDVEIAGLAAPVRALPSFSPEHLLANPLAKKDAWADLLTLRRAL
jgi:uracil-DNA glycosylase family 4